MTQFMSCGDSSSSDDDDDNDVDDPEIVDTWVSACVASGPDYIQEPYTVTSTTVNYALETYTSSTCSTASLSSSIELSGSTDFTDSNDSGDIDVDFTQAEYTAYTNTVVTAFNSSTYLGYSDWTLGVTKTINEGDSNAADANVLPKYDIYQVGRKMKHTTLHLF